MLVVVEAEAFIELIADLGFRAGIGIDDADFHGLR
jgi:hypothetical protein